MGDLSLQATQSLDASNMAADIAAMPDHIRDALWRVESAAIEPVDSPAGLIVAGMGGSAAGGMLADAVLGDRASRPVAVSRGYMLPSWTSSETTVLCSSYSGTTEETLAAFEAAGVIGARRIVATTGGPLAELARAENVPVIPMPAALQPRSAIGYTLVASLEVAALCGAADRIHTEIDVAAAHMEPLAAEWGPSGSDDGEARELARALEGRIPVIIGADATAAIAYRWKTQINEDAEIPAFNSELPEADHNEIVGWAGAQELGKFALVVLGDSDSHPRERARLDITAELVAQAGVPVHRVETRGETRIERILSLVLLGDFLAYYLAIQRGVDPTPVKAIDELKARLSQA
ncbi:MAG: bifunctional phosphoglucose/phosphomannose isomerase [Solirubrobacterales bacterium]|nr:bifunctional phosphoglucose/phosphomannose isomerase [Solirubrobacterales bacterium]